MADKRTKRILNEIKTMNELGVDGFSHVDVDTDINTVKFVMEGSENTPFYGGKFVGVLNLPEDYPHAPPSMQMLTPNGRFAVNVNICTSISNYHPESWSPMLKISTVLISLQSFMNSTKCEDWRHVGAAIELTLTNSEREERQRTYARESVEYNREKFPELFESVEGCGKRARE